MPTQRSFFGNFLATFRAQPQHLPKATPSSISPVAGVTASTATLWTAAAAPQLTKTPSANIDVPATSSKSSNHHHQHHHHHPSKPHSTPAAPSLPPLQHNVSPQTHLPRAAAAPPSPPGGLPIYGPPNKPQPSYPSVQDVRRSRRGSDSSSEGFREVRSPHGGGGGSGGGGGGGEKWFIGGLTASGEEKYYKLSMIRRERSADRISTDQLSL